MQKFYQQLAKNTVFLIIIATLGEISGQNPLLAHMVRDIQGEGTHRISQPGSFTLTARAMISI